MSRTLSLLARMRWQVVGLSAFTALALLMTSLVAGTLVGSSGPSHTYEALFRDASGLTEGSDVRISGVRVGTVKSVDLDGTTARVAFSVARDQTVYLDTTATIEFLNLLGQRYIDLETTSRGQIRPPGSTIPLSHTHDGLDLNAIFNAMKPLFESIRPEDVNQLALGVVQALQGQGPTLRHLTEQTAQLTGTLVDRDAVIGRVIDNLTAVMETMRKHRREFRSTVDALDELTGTIAANRRQVGDTIDGMQRLVTEFSSLLDAGSGSVERDVDQLAAWSASFATVAPLIGARLGSTQELLEGYIKTLSIGSFLNTYVCNSYVQIGGAPAVDLSLTDARSRRCQSGRTP